MSENQQAGVTDGVGVAHPMPLGCERNGGSVKDCPSYPRCGCADGVKVPHGLSGERLREIELGLRKYVPGTDRYDLSLLEFARAIEAAHGIGVKGSEQC